MSSLNQPTPCVQDLVRELKTEDITIFEVFDAWKMIYHCWSSLAVAEA